MTECTITVTPNLRGQPVEVDDVPRDTMAILHLEEVELMLRISDRVVWSEGGLELRDEGDPVVHPAGTVRWIGGLEKVRFELL